MNHFFIQAKAKVETKYLKPFLGQNMMNQALNTLLELHSKLRKDNVSLLISLLLYAETMAQSDLLWYLNQVTSQAQFSNAF